MAGYVQAYQQSILDSTHPVTGNTQAVAYSANGTTEFAGLARTAIGATGWAAATAATPSVKANSGALTSAAASGAGTITHTAIFTTTAAGSQITDWQAVSVSKTVGIGDQVTIAIGALTVTLD